MLALMCRGVEATINVMSAISAVALFSVALISRVI